MPLSWNEIRQNAIRFSREWAGETREHAEAKSFWDEFFGVFGIPRRSVATFEEPVRKLGSKAGGTYGFIDLFWKGRLLVEHKSRGKSLDQAESQAFDYLQSLALADRHEELPRYVIVTDFDRLALFDLEPEDSRDLPLFCGLHVQRVEIRVKDLHRHIQLFGFIPGYRVRSFAKEDPINIRAAEVMGQLHDALAEGGYSGHALERFLVRILFCLFAEDTGLFPPNAFTEHLVNQTRSDGSDLGLHLARLFEVLDTPAERRQRNLDEQLLALPYVNGALFAERLPFADFNAAMRAALLRCTEFDWSRISPAVFGSLFQSILEPKARRQIGAHYTSERDILKVVRALFLDDLRAEFEGLRHDRRKLPKFHAKLGKLKFFDPACGCGNFLVVTYRELRLLELDVLDALYQGRDKEGFWDVATLSQLDVDQMGGIEIEEWPARIAETALWLMDHQMNLLLSERSGDYFARLPLRKTALIVHGNALRLDWRTILNPAECSYILGNPPFVGKQFQTVEQKEDMALVWGKAKGAGVLDYVTCWYRKAAEFIQGTDVRVGFVSTNSITQGEQAGILWTELFGLGLKIHFGHRTFAWQSEARGKAHVHVVILGFGVSDPSVKRLYDEERGKVTVEDVRNISPYLVAGGDVALPSRGKPLCDVPPIVFGSMPNDGGHLLMTCGEAEDLIHRELGTAAWMRPYVGAEELINGTPRACLWLDGVRPEALRGFPEVVARVEGVKRHREASSREGTRLLARTPTLFGENRQPAKAFLAIPGVSSEKRPYIPIAFLPPTTVASNLLNLVPDATLYHFGILTSAMHMAWTRQVCGRLESRFRYSNKLVYNNFPWPEQDPTEAPADAPAPTPDVVCEAAARHYWSSYHDGWDEPEPRASPLAEIHPPRLARATRRQAAVETAAQAMLEARAKFPGASLAVLYDPLLMPPDLVKAHIALDRAVDRCYRSQPFTTDRQRVEYLFALYERYANPLLPVERHRRNVRRRRRIPLLN